MAELFMECEEEELEPWQQKEKAIVVDDDDDDDDDDEPIFVGEILSSKPANTYILNRVDPNSPRMGMQNGAPKRGASVAVSSGFPAATRPASSTLAVQPQPRASVSGTLQRPLSGCSSPQEATKSNAGISPPINRSAPTQSLSRNLNIPVLAQSPSRPVATVTAQPAILNRVTQNNTPNMVSIRPNSGVSPCQSGSVVNSTGLSKRPSTSEANSIIPKKAKANEMVSGTDSPISPSVKSPSDTSSVQKGVSSGNVKNGAPFPQACPKCNIHFNLLDPLKNHMKYCCPDLVHTFLGITKTDCSGTSTKIMETEKGKLIMLVNDFYYGKYEGNVQQVHQEQKTHTTFKCASCMKLLKNNLRFMNHMKHHLEFEKQNSESWESHTTCQHCYRQFPTPFQLQCHIESTHTPFESSTVCKICELSFETEQVLLQHMKDNHKPGEMPYVCQVCSYRSSAFSDVEKHFRAVHENTKNLLCPFCLKVIKIGAPYMHHYMRHQKKGVHRCNKCRLQFLTCKEKMDHKSQHHRTFKKPVQLEGLPPGTKVTIRASVGSLHPGTTTTSSLSTSSSTLQLSPNTKIANTKNHAKLTANKAKPKLKPLSVQKKQSLGTSGSCSSSSSSQNSSSINKKNNKIANTALNNLRCPEIQKCIECYSDIRTFASHFPAYVRCSLCRYSTSCSKAYVNHMMSFHSARQSKRFWIYRNHSEELRGFTVVCLNCDFLTDVSGLDKMATHLNENPTHSCQVVIENVSLNYLDAENLSDVLNNELPNNAHEEKGQNISRSTTPDSKKETSASESQQINYSAEETKEDHPGNQTSEGPLAAEGQKSKSSVLENSSGSGVQGCSEISMDAVEEGETDSLGKQASEEPLAAAGTQNKSSVLENFPSSGVPTCSKDSMDAAEEGDTDCLGNQAHADPLAAGGTENESSILENFPNSGLQTCSKDTMDATEEGDTDCLGNQADEGKENESSVLENSSGPGLQSCSKDTMDATEEGETDCLVNQADADPLAAGGTEKESSVLENFPNSGLQTCSKDTMDATEEGDTDCLGNQADADPLAAGGTENESSVLENFPNSGLQTCSKDTMDATEEGDTDCLGNQTDADPLAAGGTENESSILENFPNSGLQSCSKDTMDATEEGDTDCLGNQADADPLAAGGTENESSVLENFPNSGLQTCSKDTMDATEEGDTDCLGNQADADPLAAGGTENESSILENFPNSGLQSCSKDSMDATEEGDTDCLGNQADADPLAAGGTENESSILENFPNSGLQSCSKDSMDATEEGDTDCLGNQTDEGKENESSVLENSSGPGLQTCSKDTMDAAEEGDTDCLGNQADADPLAAGGTENESSILENFPNSGLQICSKDTMDVAEEGNTNFLGNQVDAGTENESSVLENLSGPGVQACSKDPVDFEGGNTGSLGNQTDEATLMVSNEDASAVEDPSISELSPCSKDSVEENADSIDSAKEGNAGSLGNQGDEVSLATGYKENKSTQESSPGLAVCPSEPIDSIEEANGDNLVKEASLVAESEDTDIAMEDHHVAQADECEESTSASPLGDSNIIEPQASSKRTECSDSDDDHVEKENSKKPKTDQNSDVEVSSDAVEVSDADERLTDMNIKNSRSEEGVSFEQFLRRRGEAGSSSSDTSEQGSVHLEPLTPSEVLEHEATEILQKGGVPPSAKKTGSGSERADVAISTENSPVQAEASVSQTEESSEAS